MVDRPFRVLLYRYMFFSWLFRDVNRGSGMERMAAWRHNVDASRWLPLYLRRWIVAVVGLYLVGALVELAAGFPMLSRIFYVPCAMCTSIAVFIAGLIMMFRHMQVTVDQ